jgi:hypothetical protein
MLGWDNIETDQVVVIAARTTIADAAMVFRMKCIAFLTEWDRQIGMSDVGEAMRGAIQAM